jgi:hypothetical protein
MSVRASSAAVDAALVAAGFSRPEQGAWRGELGGLAATVFVSNARERLTFLHAWLDAEPTAQALQPAFAALRQLRGSIEQSA